MKTCSTAFRSLIGGVIAAAVLSLAGCGSFVAGGIVTGTARTVETTGKHAANGATGAVKVTGRVVGGAIRLAIPGNEAEPEQQ